MKSQSGSVTVEMVLLAPVLMLLILFGVYASRASESLVQVRHAADQAARSASKVSRGRVQSVANDVANRTLNNSGTSCVDFAVSTAVIDQGSNSAVRVKVECTIKTQGLALLGVSERRVSATSTEVLDRWRVET
jgi:Flp pilus assembly protein TadG